MSTETSSTHGMRLIPAASDPQQATLVASEMRAILQELHDKFNRRVYGTGSYIKRDMRERIAAVLDATGDQPQADSAAKPLDMTATGRKRINAAADVLSEVMASIRLVSDLQPRVELALSGLRAMQALAPQTDAAEPVTGVELAARFVEKRLTDYDAEHGMTDPETGTREYPGDGDEYVSELQEIADGIRAIEAQAPGARGQA